MIPNNRLRAYIRLHLAQGVGAVTFRHVVEALGDIEAVHKASAGALTKVKGVGEKTSAAIFEVTDADVDAELEIAQKHGVTILCYEDPDYPAALKTLHDPPAVLYVRGRLEKADALGFGIVGSRRCTHYGMEQADRFAQLLARAGFTVMSGGARGVDTAAHNGALLAGGRTIAVMGCGLCEPYPPENAALYDRIVQSDRGAVISELPMRTAVLVGNFPTRNRIISGLSLGVLVVEAPRRSGALITAKTADKQGRIVFALPGRVDSPLSQGTNELIRNGVILAQDLDDILEHLGPVAKALNVVGEPAEEAVIPATLTADERKLWTALSGGPLGLDELVRTTGIASGPAASAMTMLVLKGAVSQHAGNVFDRKRKAAPARKLF